jgi:multiple sugar transport system substrate-binding protein
MKRKQFLLALVLSFVMTIFFFVVAQGQEIENPGGIRWDEPVPMVERISGDRYILPEGWKEATAGVTEISFYNSGGLQTDIATYMNMLKFEELTGIKVNAIPLAGEMMYAKALSVLVSGDGSVPLIGVGGPDTDLMPYAAGKWLVPLDVLYPPEVEKLFSSSLKTSMYAMGHWYSSPIATLGIGGCFYRPSWLEKAGVDVPKTWEELYEASKKMRSWTEQNIGPDTYGIVFPGLNVNFQYYLQSMTAAQGARWFDGETWLFDTPEFKNAFSMTVNFIKEDIASQDCINLAVWDAGRLFGLGKAAFATGVMSSYSWQYRTQFPDVENDFVYLPPLRWSTDDPDEYQSGIVTANCLAVTKAASIENQAAALLFIDFIRSKEAQRNEAVVELNESFFTSVYEEENPGDKVDWNLVNKAAELLEINPPEPQKQLLEAEARNIFMKYSQTNLFPPGYWEVLAKVIEMFGKAALGQISSDEAVVEIQKFADTF